MRGCTVISLGVLHCATTGGRAAVVTFKEGAAGPFGGTYAGTEDVMLVSNNGNGQVDQNFGGRDDFEVGEVPVQNDPRHSLIRFDVSSLAGQYATINSITLRLYPLSVTADATLGADNVQLCKTAAECGDGGACNKYSCPLGRTVYACTKPSSCQ